MAVLMPDPGSPADIELRAKSNSLLLGASEDYRKNHPHLLNSFLEEVTGRWASIAYFRTRALAAENAIVAYFKWQRQTPMNSARQSVAVDRNGALRPESLGSLGRAEQSNAFKRAASMLKASVAPGAAFLIAGEESAGQFEFLSHLVGSPVITGRPARVSFLPAPGFPAEKLPSWASDQLGFSNGDRAAHIADLTAKVADELHRQSLTLVLGSLEHLSGGVVAFQDKFWKPLFDALAEIRQRRPFRNRLIAIAAEYEPPRTEWQASIYPFTRIEPPGYDRFLLLPELNEISKGDLSEWLEENEIVIEQRPAVVDAVMKGAATVSARTAFERLRRQNLSREEGDDI
jgi:hypothetical protein